MPFTIGHKKTSSSKEAFMLNRYSRFSARKKVTLSESSGKVHSTPQQLPYLRTAIDVKLDSFPTEKNGYSTT